MAKRVFRLYETGSANIEDWQKSEKINHKLADEIKDPEGEKLKNNRGEINEITSIPSPFARLELIKSGFKFVVNNGLEGNTIYHKIVSDYFDIAQIFYRFYSVQNDFEIIEWKSGLKISESNHISVDDNSDLAKLINSSEPNQKLYGETLKLFIESDAKQGKDSNFNFDLLENIYILHYKKGIKEINVVGGTNPATLFWAGPNDNSYINITFGNDKLFDNDFYPLHKRDKDFIVYFYKLRDTINNFPKRYPEINEYLNKTYERLADEVKEMIANTSWENDYQPLEISSGLRIKVFKDFELRCNKNQIPENKLKECDFYIQSERFKAKYPNKKIPCVLPHEKFNSKLKLFGTEWNPDWEVPYYDDRPLEERNIPNMTGIPYPYLTISDFLYDYIIELPYPINKEHFETFTSEDSKFLIPIKPEIFDYFTVEELKNIITFIPKDKKIKLKIPIQKNQYIIWDRTYLPISDFDRERNRWKIITLSISFVCYPNFDFKKLESQNIPTHKIIGIYTNDGKNQNLDLEFYSTSDISADIKIKEDKINKYPKTQNNSYTSIYFNLLQDFDAIHLKSSEGEAMIIPKFEEKNIKNDEAVYAIDFGTTYTHIEYKFSNEQTTKKFSWDKLPWLHSIKQKLDDENVDLWRAIMYEFLPLIDKIEERYPFPIRSLVVYDKKLNPENKNLNPLTEINIPYWYPFMQANHLQLESNIKWSETTNETLSKTIEGFLKQLIFMIKNHAIQNNINPQKVKLIGFYPQSMNLRKRNQIQNAIKKLCSEYLKHENVLFYSESIAPYRYFVEKEGSFVVDKLGVHLDIGGGTTDIVFYHKKDILHLSSIKFAGQDLFFDGYYNEIQRNGWKNVFLPKIKGVLENSDIKNI